MFYWLMKYVVIGPLVKAIFRPWIVGRRNVPAEGAAILASNHLSVSLLEFGPHGGDPFRMGPSQIMALHRILGKLIEFEYRSLLAALDAVQFPWPVVPCGVPAQSVRSEHREFADIS